MFSGIRSPESEQGWIYDIKKVFPKFLFLFYAGKMIPFTVAPLLLVCFTIAEGESPSKLFFTMYSKTSSLALKSGPRHNKHVKLQNRKRKYWKIWPKNAKFSCWPWNISWAIMVHPRRPRGGQSWRDKKQGRFVKTRLIAPGSPSMILV